MERVLIKVKGEMCAIKTKPQETTLRNAQLCSEAKIRGFVL